MLKRLPLSLTVLVLVAGLATFIGYTVVRNTLATNFDPDLNADTRVDVTDLSILLSHWNGSGGLGDLNGDSAINIYDMSLLLSRWGDIAVGDGTAPTVPGSLRTTSVTETQIDLAWDASTDTGSGLAGYRLYQITGGTSTQLADIPVTQARSFGKAGLSAGTAYTFQVLAYDVAGNLSDKSPGLVITTTHAPLTASGCAPAGTNQTPPAVYDHVIWIWMENKNYSSVFGSVTGNGYEQALHDACGYSTNFLDNMFGSTDLPSRPHYLAAASGSNCNSGLTGASADNADCQTTNEDPSSSTKLTTQNIFSQVKAAGKTWKSYQESAGGNCDVTASGSYSPKHDPALYFTTISGSDCNTYDIDIAGIVCTASSCDTPSNQLTNDIDNGTLPNFASITPNLCNDQHDCPVAVGDQWLDTYVKRIIAGPNYLARKTAIFIIWDEANAAGAAQPGLFISPYTPPTASTTNINLFSVLRATESMLGINTKLGCASGTIPGSSIACPAGSTADLRDIFNF